MAHLACVGSHAINGVANLHSGVAETGPAEGLLRHMAGEIRQHDQRRHAAALGGTEQPAPDQADQPLHRRRLGQGLVLVSNIEPYADDAAFGSEWRAIKRANKVDLAAVILRKTGIRRRSGLHVRRAGQADT